jgi:hypothetical protein
MTALAHEPDLLAIEAFRLQLRAGSFSPLPLNGKRPLMEGWARLGDVTEHEIRRWTRTRPAETNTGVLTRTSPAFDIDLLDPEAAEAVERLARERFEESGVFPVRFGNLPKRAILFRCDEPFEKIAVELVGPSGTDGEKLEFLANGQQLVVDGIHPDTLRPYSWQGGRPGDIRRADLALTDREQAQALHDAAVALLIRDFGYRPKAKTKANKAANGAGQGDLMAGWQIDFANHDALAALTMKLLKSGMNDGAAVNFLRAGVGGLANVDEDRKARRLKEIPAMVASGRAKLDDEAAPQREATAVGPWSYAERATIARLADGDSAGFLARAKEDPGFPFEPAAISALLRVAKDRRADWQRLRAQLKAEPKIHLSALEAVMKAESANGDSGDDGLPGRPITFEETEPWPDPVEGAELLTDIAKAIGKYVIMDDCQRDAAALGAVFTHTHDLRDTAPIFFVVAPTKRCGKTRLERVIKRLARKPLMASSANPAFLARAIEKHRPTVLIDEFDAMAAGDQAMAEALRGQLNSSFDRDGAKVGKCVPLPGGGYDEREFSTWAATWIAGIRKIPDTVEDRSVVLRLKRKLSSEKVARFRGRDGVELTVLKRKIIRFVADNEHRLRDIEPDMPEALNAAGDRATDAWEPLIAIPDVAGGDWPQRARNAALTICQVDDEEDAERNIHTVLLADIRDIFARLPPRDDAAHGAWAGRPAVGPRLFTRQLLDELIGLEERPWGAWGKAQKPMTDTGLAGLLRPYRIRSTTVRGEGNVVGKGYLLRSFEDAFSRYVSIPGVSTRNNVTNSGNTGGSEDFADVTTSICYGSENAGNASNSGVRNGVTGRHGGERGSGEIEGSDDAEQDTSSGWDFDS